MKFNFFRKFEIELIEGLEDTFESIATCPFGTVLISCMCYGVNSDRGCSKWFVDEMSCYAYGDTGNPIIA